MGLLTPSSTFLRAHISSGRSIPRPDGWARAGAPPRRIPAFVEIPLLTVTAGIDVHVLRDGRPVSGSNVVIVRVGQPPDMRLCRATTRGRRLLQPDRGQLHGFGLPSCLAGPALCQARVSVRGADRASVELTLQAFGTISGTYVEADASTPVGLLKSRSRPCSLHHRCLGALLRAGHPPRNAQVMAKNAVSGRAATAQVRLSIANQVVEVFLRKRPSRLSVAP